MKVRIDVKKHPDTVFSPPDEMHLTLGGVLGIACCEILTPKPEELRQMLLDLRKQHRWSQGFAAAVLGVGLSTVIKWEAGRRNPRGSAAKLIFLLYSQLVEKAGKVKNPWDLVTWGKIPCRGTLTEAHCIELALNGTYFVPEGELHYKWEYHPSNRATTET